LFFGLRDRDLTRNGLFGRFHVDHPFGPAYLHARHPDDGDARGE
jgi:hypothetical protein